MKAKEPKKVKQIIASILNEDMENEYQLLHKIHRMKFKRKPMLYVGILKALTDLKFPPDKAQDYWKKILGRRKLLSKKIGDDVSFRVAMLDYFINTNKIMHNPMIIEIKMYKQKIRMALIDTLTNLYNRAYLGRALSKEIKRAKRYKETFSVLFFDMDNFKKCNDTYGHITGDRILKKASRVLAEYSREEDTGIRYGGEEFLVLMPRTPKKSAALLANRLRKKIQAIKLPKGKYAEAGISISGGISSFPSDSSTGQGLIKCADKALYKAKYLGKNKICLYNKKPQYKKIKRK